MTNTMVKSVEDIRKVLKDNSVGVDILSPQINPEDVLIHTDNRPSQRPKNLALFKNCTFCSASISVYGIKAHQKTCIMNPNRVSYVGKVCPECQVVIGNQGFSRHVARCNGDSETFLKHRAYSVKTRVRKQRGIVTPEAITNAVNRVDDKAEVKVVSTSSDLEAFISIMRDQIADSGVTFREFNAWISTTKTLWNRK